MAERSQTPPSNSIARGMPANLDAEKLVIGSILLDSAWYAKVSARLRSDDFSLEKHRRIFKRMGELHARSETIDHLTVSNELLRWNELESCGGLSYLVSLQDGLPQLPSIDAYVKIVKEKSLLRRMIFASQNMQQRCMAGEDDPSNILRSLGSYVSKMQMAYDPEPPMRTPLEIIESHEGGAVGFLTQGIKMGLSTGFPQLDEKIMGLQKGGYYIFAGVPKSGKSSIVKDICLNLARTGHPGLVFSVEMSKEQWIGRALCSIAEVPLKPYIKNELDKEQRHEINKALAVITEISEKGMLYIDETPDLMISDFEQRVSRAVAEKKIQWFALDYLQLLETSSDKNMKFFSATEAVTYASSVCRRICRKYGIPGLVVSSLTKPSDRKKQAERPTYNDLRQSGQISFDAFAVIMIHRPEMFQPGKAEFRGKAEAIVGLTRMGEAGTVHLEFRSRYTKFLDNGPPEEWVDPNEE
jgi:replicative DNA helicase